MDSAQRAAKLAQFEQAMENGIAASLRDAAAFDHLTTTDAVFALFESTLAAAWDRETLAMAYAQLAVRLHRGTGDPRG